MLKLLLYYTRLTNTGKIWACFSFYIENSRVRKYKRDAFLVGVDKIQMRPLKVPQIASFCDLIPIY